MRRYIFYPAIALLGFGIGSFSFVDLIVKSDEQNVKAQTIPTNTANSIRNISEDEGNYEEQTAFEVLKPTIKKWLRGEDFKEEFTAPSAESIKDITGKDKSELDEAEKNWFSYLGFEPRLIDVDGDGQKELAIRNYCAPVGNCQFWLFKKKADDYEIILSIKDNSVQRYKLIKEKTNGYFDLETKAYNDAFSGEIAIYKFDGKEYKADKCFWYEYQRIGTKNGQTQYSKNPVINSSKCIQE